MFESLRSLSSKLCWKWNKWQRMAEINDETVGTTFSAEMSREHVNLFFTNTRQRGWTNISSLMKKSSQEYLHETKKILCLASSRLGRGRGVRAWRIEQQARSNVSHVWGLRKEREGWGGVGGYSFLSISFPGVRERKSFPLCLVSKI